MKVFEIMESRAVLNCSTTGGGQDSIVITFSVICKVNCMYHFCGHQHKLPEPFYSHNILGIVWKQNVKIQFTHITEANLNWE